MQNNQKFIIEGLGGKKTLKGTVSISGSKNFTLPAMAMALLFKDPLTLKNVPEIEDVFRMAEILEDLGVEITRGKNELTLKPRVEIKSEIGEIANKLRGSIVLLGSIMGRTGKVIMPHPGGCAIGPRPIDLFIENFKKMGVKVQEKNSIYTFDSKGEVKNTELIFRHQVVTATITFLLVAVLGKGKMILENCALEPEVVELAKYLKENGALISGIGTTRMEIVGRNGKLLENPKPLTIIPDRIEAGSFAILGALAGEKIKITNCEPSHLTVFLETLKDAGGNFKINKNEIIVSQSKDLNGISIRTHEYPGFPTDLQSPFTVLLTQAKGESVVFETIFENRLKHAEDLVREFGAKIQILDTNHIIINGGTPLKAGKVESLDLRAGFAFIIAGIIAKGKSEISNIYLIDRGYENIEQKLQKIGVKITRTNNLY